MRRAICFLFLFLCSRVTNGFGVFEPTIECTVIKVHSKGSIWGITKFPQLYQTINNDPLKSRLHIARQLIRGVIPRSIWKIDGYEKILIRDVRDSLELEIHGKPLSRNGTLKVNGTLVANVTCHWESMLAILSNEITWWLACMNPPAKASKILDGKMIKCGHVSGL